MGLGLPLPSPDAPSIVNALRVWRDRLDALLGLEVLDRPRIFAVDLKTGANVVEHKLGRKPRGWVIVAPRGGALVAQIGEADALRLPLTSTADISLTLWVW